IAEALQKKAVEALETEDRGTEAERYEIINSTNAPTVLMEMVYLTDQSDYSKITNEEYQNALAEALADGIREELGTLYPTREQDIQNLNNNSAVQ
ncbi:MAG: N-acetylmuramoyl-L-alanine amidase, partial [Firmicutes bacterium]|nr:N-acetylmuramoyl-L-alanine amidase [Bacillota bacterium]